MIAKAQEENKEPYANKLYHYYESRNVLGSYKLKWELILNITLKSFSKHIPLNKYE